MSREMREIEIQRCYYAENAHLFDARNIHEGDEHHFALGIMVGLIDFLKVRTVLDIGAGTGRTLTYLHQRRPDIQAIGVEPADGQLKMGYEKGLSPNQLLNGDGTNLNFPDKA